MFAKLYLSLVPVTNEDTASSELWTGVCIAQECDSRWIRVARELNLQKAALKVHWLVTKTAIISTLWCTVMPMG